VQDKSLAKLQGYLTNAIGRTATEDDPYTTDEMNSSMCGLAGGTGGDAAGLLLALSFGKQLPGCNITDDQYEESKMQLVAYADAQNIDLSVDINKQDLEVACILCKLTYATGQGPSWSTSQMTTWACPLCPSTEQSSSGPGEDPLKEITFNAVLTVTPSQVFGGDSEAFCSSTEEDSTGDQMETICELTDTYDHGPSYSAAELCSVDDVTERALLFIQAELLFTGIASVLVTPVIGILSERFGRKWLFLFTLLGPVVRNFVPLVTTEPSLLVVGMSMAALAGVEFSNLGLAHTMVSFTFVENDVCPSANVMLCISGGGHARGARPQVERPHVDNRFWNDNFL